MHVVVEQEEGIKPSLGFWLEQMGGRGECRKGIQEKDGKFEREGNEFGSAYWVRIFGWRCSQSNWIHLWSGISDHRSKLTHSDREARGKNGLRGKKHGGVDSMVYRWAERGDSGCTGC